MTATLFLRIASILSLINCIAHTGGMLSSPRHGAEEVAVIETMKAHHFDVMGSLRSYWDFLFGYGFSVTITLLVQAILFWQLAAIAKRSPAETRPIVALFLFNCIGIAIISWKYFFIGPAVTQLLMAVCLGMAFVQGKVRGNVLAEATR